MSDKSGNNDEDPVVDPITAIEDMVDHAWERMKRFALALAIAITVLVISAASVLTGVN